MSETKLRSCHDCQRSYSASGELDCGAGSQEDPQPFWATEGAVLRILTNGGRKSGRERAEAIDPTMATECAAFAQK